MRYSRRLFIICWLMLIFLLSGLTCALAAPAGTTSGVVKPAFKDAEANTGAVIQIGDTIKTMKGSAAEIVFPDGTSLRLEESTHFTVGEARGRSYITLDGRPGTGVD